MEDHGTIHVVMKRFDDAKESWWATNLWEDLEDSISAN